MRDARYRARPAALDCRGARRRKPDGLRSSRRSPAAKLKYSSEFLDEVSARAGSVPGSGRERMASVTRSSRPACTSTALTARRSNLLNVKGDPLDDVQLQAGPGRGRHDRRQEDEVHGPEEGREDLVLGLRGPPEGFRAAGCDGEIPGPCCRPHVTRIQGIVKGPAQCTGPFFFVSRPRALRPRPG